MKTLYHTSVKDTFTKDLNTKISWITLNVNNRDYTAFLDNNLPVPTILQHHNIGYKIAWAIKGYFGTKKSNAFYLDTVEKLVLLFNDCNVTDVQTKVTAYSHLCKALYDLKDFSDIEDRRNKKSFVERNRKTNAKEFFKDEIFEMARFKCYDLKLDGRLSYEACYDVFYTINLKYNLGKDKDIKYKAKSVYEWTRKNYNPIFKSLDQKIEANRKKHKKYNNKRYGNEGEELVTRSENAKLQTKNMIDKNKAKVLGAIKSLEFLQEKVTSVRLAEYTGLSRQTCSKYLREIKSEK